MSRPSRAAPAAPQFVLILAEPAASNPARSGWAGTAFARAVGSGPTNSGDSHALAEHDVARL